MNQQLLCRAVRVMSLALFLFSLAATSVAATPGVEGEENTPAQVLHDIVVKGQMLDSHRAAYSSSHFDASTIKDLNISATTELFDRVPGMSMRKLGLPGVADSIVIRGFGGGGHGGDLGAVIDGIPLNEAMSHADGYVDFNVIVPLEVESFAVYKGPVSALYGNYNRGGLVRVDTKKSGDYTLLDGDVGSDGIVDVQAAHGMGIGTSQQLNLAMQHYRSDGYRPQSATEHTTLSGRWGMDLTDKTDVALSARWHRADSDSPSYLTEPQYLSQPYGIHPNVQNDGADKKFGTVRIDLNHDINESMRVLTFAYTTQQEFSRWFTRPVGGGNWRQREESYDRSVSGAGISLNGIHTVGQTDVVWVGGLERFREATDFEYYDGLDFRARVNPAIDDRRTRLNSVAGFGEVQADLYRLFMPSVGVRYDRFSGDCRLQGAETGSNPCQSLNDLDNLSPKFGFRSLLHDTLEARISWSEGFALPNGWVKYQAEATNLDPVIFRQKEVGFTWRPHPTFDIDVAAYALKTSGEVRTVAPGVYENYGATKRTGVEATANWVPVETLSISAVYGVADSKVLKHENASLLGNEVGGVPEYSANLSAFWSFVRNWQLDINWRWVGGYTLSVQNIDYAASHDYVDLGLSYFLEGNRNWKFYARADNLTDEVYAPAHMVIGGEQLFSVGAPRQLRAGVQVSF